MLKKLMTGTLLVLVTSLSEVTAVCAQEKEEINSGIPTFYLEYAITENLKGDGEFETLMKLNDLSFESATSLADFWHSWANRECGQFIENAIDKALKRAKGKPLDQNHKKELMKEGQNCRTAFYFDKWDGINQSIRTRLKSTKERK